eukprot:TRINITY_DN4045_c0_g1_i1.p1 TRINITY_DN4045_c0_g1~~TRINITY_DN4045_c0_g1_i1.p1  ORF type:complete len:355 (-),score=47.55 TRINITY_DN4045_c0_g1_i1:720-1784(-)
MLWLIFLSTVVLWIFIVLRYLQKINFLKSRMTLGPNETLQSSGLLTSLIWEIIMLIPHPTPLLMGITFQNYNPYEKKTIIYHANDILYIAMLMRVFIVVRVLLDNTKYYSTRAQRLCDMYGCEPGFLFSVKCLMKMRPFPILFIGMVLSILVFGFALRVCERPLYRVSESMDFTSYYNACWCIIVTMTTVGYGDFFPRTLPGRVIVVTVCIWGVFLVSMMVVTLTNTLALDGNENKVLNLILRLEFREELVDEAARVLTNMARYRLDNKLNNGTNEAIIKEKIRRHIDNFKSTNRFLRTFVDPSSVNEDIFNRIDLMRSELKELEDRQIKMEGAINTLIDSIGFLKDSDHKKMN